MIYITLWAELFWDWGPMQDRSRGWDPNSQNGAPFEVLSTLPRVIKQTSVNPVHNSQVCYFNNVWFMFLIFKKNFSFQTTVGPPPSAVLYIFPIVAKHWFSSNHTGPKWFSTHRRTIHPLDAWTYCEWTWTSPVPSTPVLVHRH
jgi:hypothetical protein